VAAVHLLTKIKKYTEYQDATSYILEILSKNSKKNNFKITKKNICVHMPCTQNLLNIDFSKLIDFNKIPGFKYFYIYRQLLLWCWGSKSYT
jgi:hypothetical protein